MSNSRKFQDWFEEQQDLGERCGVSLGWQSEELMEAAWNASRTAIEIELPRTVGYDGYPDGELMKSEEVISAIEASGLKVKKDGN
jgi:hypothetical protein